MKELSKNCIEKGKQKKTEHERKKIEKQTIY